MPLVTKQSPRAVKPPPLPQTHATNDLGIKLSCYGRAKVGKTRLASTFPKPLIIIGTEDGTKSIATGRKLKAQLPDGPVIYSLLVQGREIGIDFALVNRSAWIAPLIDRAKRGYASLCLDHAGGLQDIVLKEVLGLEEIPLQGSWGMAQQSQWQAIGAQMKKHLRDFLDLADTGTNLIIISHERNFGMDEQASDVMVPSVGAALMPSVSGWLSTACDYLCQAYVAEEVVTQEMTIAGKVTKMAQKSGKIEYRLRIGPHPVFATGFRLPDGVVLPDSINNPSYHKLIKLIAGESV